jgi:tetratricopeptide (TPR) repeat protein
VSWDRIGDLRLRLGDGDGARQAFEASLAIRQDLARRDPANAEWQRDLSVSWDRIGDLRLGLGDGDGARQAFEASLAIAQDLARRDPANAQWQRDLFVSYWRMARIAEHTGDKAAERDWLRKAHDQLAGMQARGVKLSGEDEGFLKRLKDRLGH